MPKDNLTLAVSGAGIAGLTVALACARQGFELDVYERAPALEELGAGVQLSPNATRLLGRLGLLENLRAVSTEPDSILISDAGNLKPLATLPLKQPARSRWGAPYLVLRRADLQTLLLKAVEATTRVRIHTGTSVTGFTAQQDSVMLDIADIEAENRHHSLLIAADGIHSPIRRQMSGPESRFTQDMAFRAILPASAVTGTMPLPNDRVATFAAPGFHLVSYPLTGGAFNLVVILPAAALQSVDAPLVESKTLVQAAPHAHADLLATLAAVSSWHAWPIHEIRPDFNWSAGNHAILIGDAAHAMAPHAAQGAAMAIEDAVLFADLAGRSGLSAAMLQTFQSQRKPRIERVIRRGRFNHFAWQARWPISMARNLVLSMRSADSLAQDFDWLYGFDVQSGL